MKPATQSLFELPDETAAQIAPADSPLAERLRPTTLEEFVGQRHLVGEDRLIGRLMAGRGNLPSLILWGGPGSGKTTLARILANRPGMKFQALSAVLSGVKELREAIATARGDRRRGLRTVLFIDEIHRFNKSQQDALLPAVEDGTVTLIGATTENPSFEVNAALLSRARVLVLEPLSETDVMVLLKRALVDSERGLTMLRPHVTDESLGRLAKAAGGDARAALTALESAVQA
ncbi:MAG TPA: AAA family ATPase, partial [Caulifigura sp.]|nr:AAA family ATPase [Caulifigura sp.]